MKCWAWGAMVVTIGAIGSSLSACGSVTSSGAGGAGGAGGDTSATSSSSSMIGMACAMKPTKQDCFTCCEDALPMANVALVNDLVEACACDALDGGLAAPCASDPACQMQCVDKTISDPCVMCVNAKAIKVKPQDPCVSAGYKRCQVDPMCTPLLDCANKYCTQAT